MGRDYLLAFQMASWGLCVLHYIWRRFRHEIQVQHWVSLILPGQPPVLWFFFQTDMSMEAPGGKLCRDVCLHNTAEATGSHEVGVAWAFLPTTPSESPIPPYLSPPLQMPASMAQDRLCTLAHQLHAAYSSLATSLQGLPEVQQQAGQARHSLCKLYSLVSSKAGTELQAEELAQSSAAVAQAWQGLEGLLDKLQQSPPLSWLVGPFTSVPCDQL